MNADDYRNLQTEVMKTGLAGLAELQNGVSDFVQVIAKIVNNWETTPNRQGEWIDRHKFLRDLFAECDQAERGAMYTAIKPHLTFPVLPLASYETMMTERMHKLVSKGAARVEGRTPEPIVIGGKKYAEASASEATAAIAKVRCTCGKRKVFIAGTPVGAMIAARQAGWKRIADREMCPHCVKKLLNDKRRVH